MRVYFCILFTVQMLTNETYIGESKENQVQTKTYFWTDRLANKFPPEFSSSRNRKWVVVQGCKATLKDKLVGDVILHADFIERDHYLDYACCFVNEEASRDVAKYEIINNRPDFNLWFTDLENNKVDIEAFALRLLLIY